MEFRLELFKIGFLTVTIIDILDVLIISYILYRLYFFIRGSRAAQMFVGLVIILVASVFVQLLGMSGLNWIFDSMRTVWLIAFVILIEWLLFSMMYILNSVSEIIKQVVISVIRLLRKVIDR